MVDNQSQPIIPGTGARWINLKIPKEEDVMEDHNYDSKIQKMMKNNSSRICHVCNKGFSSGKALGGHMRIHLQPDTSMRKKKKSINYNQPSIITCSVCGKNFPSMKSLFGHMRSHPDRDWRGIHPPTNNNNNVTCVDLSKAVGGWSVTAKRGRNIRSCKHQVINYSSEEEQQVHDAVQYLMLLPYGDSLQSSRLTGKQLEIRNSNSHRIAGTNNICQMKRIKTRGRKMMKLKDLTSIQEYHPSNNPVPHHNKFNIVIQNLAEDSKLFVENTNECKTISITNDDKPPQVSSYSSSQVSCVIRSSIRDGARILDFDLNELPLPEDDDEAAGNRGCVTEFFSQL